MKRLWTLCVLSLLLCPSLALAHGNTDEIFVEAPYPGEEVTLVITQADGEQTELTVMAPQAGYETEVIYTDDDGHQTSIIVQSPPSRVATTVVVAQPVYQPVQTVGYVQTVRAVRPAPVRVTGGVWVGGVYRGNTGGYYGRPVRPPPRQVNNCPPRRR